MERGKEDGLTNAVHRNLSTTLLLWLTFSQKTEASEARIDRSRLNVVDCAVELGPE